MNTTTTSVFASRIYTGNEVIENAYVNFAGEKLLGVSSEPAGREAGTFAVITPAFIDAHSHIGLVRAGEPSDEEEANDQLDPFLPHADVLDSIQMDDKGFKDSIEAGILYSCVVPGSGNIIGGKSAVIRNYGKDTTEALIARAGIKSAFGYNPMSTREWKGSRPYTRMGAMSLLRTKLHEVQEKLKKEKAAGSNAAGEAGKTSEAPEYSASDLIFKELLEGKNHLRAHVHKADDIAALLRLVEEFGIRLVVDHTCDIHDDHIYRRLAEKKVPVVYGPMDCLAYKVELKHEDWRNLRFLIDSGVTFGLMTDHPVIMQNLLHIQLRWFIRCGLSKQAALEIITRSNAAILGIDSYLGTLEKDKWASFVCWNGDPFELTSYPEAVYAEGRPLYEGE